LNLIACLETYPWLTLYPINPVSLQNYRQALVTSRAKDDTKDARRDVAGRGGANVTRR